MTRHSKKFFDFFNRYSYRSSSQTKLILWKVNNLKFNWNFCNKQPKLIFWNINATRATLSNSMHQSKNKRMQSRVDFINFVVPYLDCLHSTPNFYATKSFSKVGHRTQTVWRRVLTYSRNHPFKMFSFVQFISFKL